MTEKMYRIIWTDTVKAMKYLHKKGCFSVSDSIPANCTEPGLEKAVLDIYQVSDTTEKMRKHVAKTYPNAMIEYVDRETVADELMHRAIAFAEYIRNI